MYVDRGGEAGQMEPCLAGCVELPTSRDSPRYGRLLYTSSLDATSRFFDEPRLDLDANDEHRKVMKDPPPTFFAAGVVVASQSSIVVDWAAGRCGTP